MGGVAMLADWSTGSGTASTPVFVQGSSNYLDTSQYADIVFCLEVSSAAGGTRQRPLLTLRCG